MEDKVKKEVYIVTPRLYEIFYPSPQFIEPVVKKAYIKYDYDEDDELFLLTDENDKNIAIFDKKKIYHSYEEACNAKIDMMKRYMNFLIDKEGELKDAILKNKKMLDDVLDCKKILINKIKKQNDTERSRGIKTILL